MTNNDVMAFLTTRRSVKPMMLCAPGPDPAQLESMLRIASRVPDHKKLAPWRFIVFEGEARSRIGEHFAQACLAEDRQPPSEVRLQTERERFLRAPMVIAVIVSPKDKPGVPEQEQVLSTGAAAFNLCLAANAMGFGTCWLTEWIAYSPMVHGALGLGERERVAGFVYVGTADERQGERDRPELSDIVSRWEG